MLVIQSCDTDETQTVATFNNLIMADEFDVEGTPNPSMWTYNIGTGQDVSIKELVYKIKDVVGYAGDIEFDTSKPDGTMKKLLDVSQLASLGWKYQINLEEGLKTSVDFYQSLSK